MQKLSCYVDEAGQDPTSEFFIVVAVVSEGEQNALRKKLEQLEKTAGTNRKKWHKVRHANRLRYLTLLVEQKVITGEVYFAHYRKPLPYFFPMIEVVEKAIKAAARKPYRANIYRDISQTSRRHKTLLSQGLWVHLGYSPFRKTNLCQKGQAFAKDQ